MFQQEANLNYQTAFILGVFVILVIILIFAYLSFLKQSNAAREELRNAVELASSNQKSLQQQKDEIVASIKNLHPALLDLWKGQQIFTANVDKALTSITVLEQSLRPIVDLTQRLDRILSGAQSKGALGEKIVSKQLEQLPPEWISRNEKFSDRKVVEFCLRAPNGQLVPIDSKWAATELLDQLGQVNDKELQNAIVRRIRREVSDRALEARKYLDKHRTMGFCIVAVPDPVFAYCLDVQPRLIVADIVLISYSLLIPYILLLIKFFWTSVQSAQALQVSHVLNRSILQIAQIQQDIDTQVRGPIDDVKFQQSQYVLYTQQLQAACAKLNQIQNELNAVQSLLPDGIPTIPHDKLSSISDNLQQSLKSLREDIFEGSIKHENHETRQQLD